MSEFISLAEAAGMTALYRSNRDAILDQQYKGLDILCVSETFEKEQVLSLLGNTGCEALRVYFGMDENMLVHTILVGVDENDEDMVPPGQDPANYLLERGKRCPTQCPPDSPLNS
jgi:hypothetical protein